MIYSKIKTTAEAKIVSAVVLILMSSGDRWSRTTSTPPAGPARQERSNDQRAEGGKERQAIGILESLDTLATGNLEG